MNILIENIDNVRYVNSRGDVVVEYENGTESCVEIEHQDYAEIISKFSVAAYVPESFEDILLRQMLLTIAELNLRSDEFMTGVTQATYPEFEKQTFERQREEAINWQADNSSPTPLVDILASNREVDRELLLQKILTKVQQFEVLSFSVAGQRQKYEDQIKSATTVAELEAMEFTFNV